VETGEECDDGAANGQVCSPAYGGSCTYCSLGCTEITLGGGTCGDDMVQLPEVCDPPGPQACTTSISTSGSQTCSGNCLTVGTCLCPISCTSSSCVGGMQTQTCTAADCSMTTVTQACIAQTTMSISQWGITWTFDQPTEFGNFANGDFWALGPVTITSITPDFQQASIGGGTYWINGMEINPTTTTRQGYDERAFNFDFGAYPTLPYVATGAFLISSFIC